MTACPFTAGSARPLVGHPSSDREPMLRRFLVPRSRCVRLSLCAAALSALFAFAASAHATQYWKLRDLLANFWPNDKTKIAPKPITLSDADAAQIAKKLGVKEIRKSWSVYIAELDGKRLGYAIKDDEVGLHDPIDFAVRFN